MPPRPSRHLHVPGKPVVFANIWDVPSPNTMASLNHGDNELVHAVATASWALAAPLGLRDEELTFEHNNGYGSRIEEIVTEAVKAGGSAA
ncbi:hypothetical protein C2857_004213 [Epichloe festucae Fl1]|uniref:Uncharacterized protein n=1 Tax=Epichloe festucae (strain Fl1) TaxID=877507 RepID=A0A7S9PU71_EPIFF|nr:hypothetical protein C2857_004213 [Epichloe festucae Fl1]